MNWLTRLWWRIYPNTDKEHWWMPLMWLPFMFWFFVFPLWKHASLAIWIVNTVVGACLRLRSTCRPLRAAAGSG